MLFSKGVNNNYNFIKNLICLDLPVKILEYALLSLILTVF